MKIKADAFVIKGRGLVIQLPEDQFKVGDTITIQGIVVGKESSDVHPSVGLVVSRLHVMTQAADTPEACPVAWQVVSAQDGYSWGVFDRSNGGEQEATEVAKRGPYRVVPLYAHPASATAEGEAGRVIPGDTYADGSPKFQDPRPAAPTEAWDES